LIDSSKDYSKIPDSLKWAIPVAEASNRPHVVEQARLRKQQALAELREEEKLKIKSKMKVVR